MWPSLKWLGPGLVKSVGRGAGEGGSEGVSGVTGVPNWMRYSGGPFFTERHGPGRVPDPPVRNDRDRPLLSLQRDSIGFVNSGCFPWRPS
jgi:hypothetical protein